MMIMLLMIILPINHCLGQEVTDQALLKDQYLLKANRQKTAAWVTLGIGTTMAILGTVVTLTGFKDWQYSQVGPIPVPEPSSNREEVGAYMALTGAAMSLASIPLFISAGSNKKKAASISVGYQHIYNASPDMMASHKAMPSLVLRVEF